MSDNLVTESGIRDINHLKKRYPKAEIYFHQDLDGVTTALAMKNYLENNGIKVVDAHVIQYGDKEFAVKKNDAKGDTMPVLVDFAHGKPMFVIHTDHHDRQVGVEKETSKSFKSARSNVETISQLVSPKDIFTSSDILLINTVDSADFARHDISPDEVINYIFRLDKENTLQKNKMLLGLVINKLLLAFKNKKGFLEGLVLDSEPSLMSILNNIKAWMKKNTPVKTSDLQQNALDYVNRMKTYPKVSDNIIFQYGGGEMFKPGSYDRYTPFKNNPEADFLIMAWPMGLVQASCNPFKKDRELKGVNLGEIAQEVLGKWETQLKGKMVPLSTIKWVSETSVGPVSVGFTYKDFDAIYGDKFREKENGESALDRIHEMMEKPFKDLEESDLKLLDEIEISAWDLIQANSGGHKCITNISGLNYLGRTKRVSGVGNKYDMEEAPWVKFTRMVAAQFENVLKEKIEKSKQTVSEAKDYFKGSHFGDEKGKNLYSVEKVYDFVKKNKKKYLKNNFPLDKIKHNLEWWNKNYDIENKAHKKRMMNADTSYPILVIKEKDGNLSVADGLNRLYKAIKIEKKDVLPVYYISNKKDIEDLKEKID